jgi:hypothetical protein
MGRGKRDRYIAERIAVLLRRGEPRQDSYEAGELAAWRRLLRGKSRPRQTLATEYGRGELDALLAAAALDRRLML